MDGALSPNPPSSLSSRPRLTPGVPAGGIAAIIVALGVIGWGLAAGGDGRDNHRMSVSFDAPEPPEPPEPPEAPTPPRPPRAPGDVHVNVDIDPAMVERTVRDAMRGVDVDATHMQALRDAQAGLADARREIEEARARLRAEGKDVPAIAEGALRVAEMGVAAASGAAMGAANSANAGEGSLMQSFDAPKGVQLVNIGGDVTIERSSRADKVKLEIDKGARTMDVVVKDGVLTVRSNSDPHVGNAEIRLTMPSEGDLTVAGLAGNLSIGGRSDGKLSVQLLRGDVSAERVGALSVDIKESGSVSVQRVEGDVRFNVSGSGELSVERAQSAQLEIQGHANVSLGRVEEGVSLSIPGHAEVDIGRADGPIKVDFPGAGSVSIGSGEARPLQANVSGAGTFEFNGTAYDPLVVASGSGNVHIAKHEGKANVRNTGVGNTFVGD
ncbi:GIN domain-containing protein [Niveispirillum sp. KHB5.9]|uniref:GIN domain-containing protein n=1 Tax=Niveispirillum sp. KHB5.9 TaxID=3400269 RepID=UPI003A87155E